MPGEQGAGGADVRVGAPAGGVRAAGGPGGQGLELVSPRDPILKNAEFLFEIP